MFLIFFVSYVCVTALCTVRAGVKLKLAPHAHVSGGLIGSHQYLKQIPSLNSDLFRLKLYLLSAKPLNQLEAPFSEARSIAYLSISFKALMRFVFFRFLSVFNFLIFVQIFSCCVIAVTGSWDSSTSDVSLNHSR